MIIQLLKIWGICLAVIMLICIGSLAAPVIHYYIRKIFGSDSEITYMHAEGYCDPNNNSCSHVEGQGISDNYTHAEGYYSKAIGIAYTKKDCDDKHSHFILYA